jgi:hypothetical protein
MPVFFCLWFILWFSRLQVYFEWFMTVEVRRVICRSKRGIFALVVCHAYGQCSPKGFCGGVPPCSACVSGGFVFRFKVFDRLPLR